MATPIPTNRASFRVAEILAVTEGTLLAARDAAGGDAPATARDVLCEGVSTDTREVTQGALFVALAGERFDGHDYAAAAVERGASALLVHRDIDRAAVDRAAKAHGRARPAVVRVDDTRAALGRLALAHRLRWAEAPHPAGPRRVVAITGFRRQDDDQAAHQPIARGRCARTGACHGGQSQQRGGGTDDALRPRRGTSLRRRRSRNEPKRRDCPPRAPDRARRRHPDARGCRPHRRTRHDRGRGARKRGSAGRSLRKWDRARQWRRPASSRAAHPKLGSPLSHLWIRRGRGLPPCRGSLARRGRL